MNKSPILSFHKSRVPHRGWWLAATVLMVIGPWDLVSGNVRINSKNYWQNSAAKWSRWSLSRCGPAGKLAT